ncbi:hypothetical protein E2C01_043653 [Portunus trituberculatus]|uniref:Uncharacterized protein n=1 Tax=Portunus trituberculatus TaxID=210409 RepID=A0A5B7FXA3_PORTR|nr:hypothetical protein [Portunus trituberculatus]
MSPLDDTDGRASAFCVSSPQSRALSCRDAGLRLSKGYRTTGKLAKLPAVGLNHRDAQLRGLAVTDGASVPPKPAPRTSP